MRVNKAESVARRAVLFLRFVRAVPNGRCIEVSWFSLGMYSLMMPMVGAAVSATVVVDFVLGFFACVRVH